MHILDIAQNAIRAKADLITIKVKIDDQNDVLTVRIEDNGCGMSDEMLESVRNPFTTTRTTRNVGLGIPLFAASCEKTQRKLSIDSQLDVGTILTAQYAFSHIDRPPVGDIAQTIYTLTIMNPNIDFVLTVQRNEAFEFDTRQIKQTLDGVPITTPDVSAFINGFLQEGIEQVFGGSNI